MTSIIEACNYLSNASAAPEQGESSFTMPQGKKTKSIFQDARAFAPLFFSLGLLISFFPAAGVGQGTAEFGGIVITESGTPVPGARVSFQNLGKCVRSPSGFGLICSPPTVNSSLLTDIDGRFLVRNLPADFFLLCARRTRPDELDSCKWHGYGDAGDPSVTLREGQSITNLKLILRTGTMIFVEVEDRENFIARGILFNIGIISGDGQTEGVERLSAENPVVYRVTVPRTANPRLFIDTWLLMRNEAGDSLPLRNPSMLVFTGPDEVRVRLTATPAMVSAASFWPGMAHGGIAVLSGKGLTNVSGVVAASSLPLPIQLAGTSVTINEIPAPLFAVANTDGQEQVILQVPFEIPSDRGITVVVDNNGVQQQLFLRGGGPSGIFVRDGQPIIQRAADGSLVSQENPALRGEVIVIYATGLGLTLPGVPAGFAAPVQPLAQCLRPPFVRIGEAQARVLFCGLVPGFVGLHQVNVEVPSNVSPGTVPLVMNPGSVFSGNTVALPIQ